MNRYLSTQQQYQRNPSPRPTPSPRPVSTVPHASQNELWGWFRAVDADGSGAISVQELQRALVNGNWTNFDVDTCQMLMNMFDADRSGNIGFQEFEGLWKYITDWQNVFRHFDRDRSGSIDGSELADALRAFGYNLSPKVLQLIQIKYGSLPPDPSQGYSNAFTGITFDRFVRACVTVKTLTESFQREDTDRDGWATINYETFMQIVLSAP